MRESVTEKVEVPAGQDNIALTDSIVSKDVVAPARIDTVAETVAATTPTLKKNSKGKMYKYSLPLLKKEQKKRQLYRLNRILWGIRLWEQKPLIPSRKGKR